MLLYISYKGIEINKMALLFVLIIDFKFGLNPHLDEAIYVLLIRNSVLN